VLSAPLLTTQYLTTQYLTTQYLTTQYLTTQYLEEADQLADSISVLDHGKIVAQGTDCGHVGRPHRPGANIVFVVP
jgi:ABC-type multidrug transport system ATPase subunit